MLQYLACFCVVLLTAWWYSGRKERAVYWKKIKEIPGPPHNPIIGYTNSLTESDAFKVFERDRELSRLYHPVCRIWFLNVAFVLLSGPEDIEKVLSNPIHNNKGKEYHLMHDWLGTGLLTSHGAKWQTRRKILTPAFHFSILQEFVSVFNNSLKSLLKHLNEQCDKDYVEVNVPVTRFTINAIGETSMGLNFSDDTKCESYRKAVIRYCQVLAERLRKPLLRNNIYFKFTSSYKDKIDATETLHNVSNSVIKERESMFKDGVISYTNKKKLAMLDLMLSAKYKGADITNEGIREEVDTFMFGGHDTTASAISYALMVFANESEIQEEAYQEIMSVVGQTENPTYLEINELKYLERCMKEVLRLYPSAAAIARVAGEDIVTTTGHTIPKDTDVGIMIYDMHRNPRLWENPEKFDPDRFLPENIAKRHPYSYIPFSAGSRNCIGHKYAMLELKTAMCGILREFELKPVDKPGDIKYQVDLVLRPHRDVRVKFVPRSQK